MLSFRFLWLTLLILITLLTLISCNSSDNQGNTDHTDKDNTNDTSTNEYTITLEKGSFATGKSVVLRKKHNVDISLPSTTSLVYEGYVLIGWQEVEGAEEFYPVGSTFNKNEDVTLYPVWDVMSYRVILSPGANGTETETKLAKYHGEPLTLPGAVFTRVGYTQIGWSLSDGGETAFALSDSYLDDADLTLYPAWKKNVYTVSLLPGADGVGSSQSFTAEHGKTVTLPGAIFTKTDYELVGWATSEGGASVYEPSASVKIQNDLTLYPVWALTKTFSYSIDFEKLPKTYMTSMSVADIALYYKMVNAYLNYQSEVSFTSDTNPYLVTQVFTCYFPVFYADGNPYGPYVNTAENIIHFYYESASKQEHDARIAEFVKMAEVFLKDFNRTDTDVERALLIYQRLLESMTYDETMDLYPYDNSAMMESAFYAITSKTGSCKTFANAFCFLLTQANVDAISVCSVYDKDESVVHYWTAFNLDSKWYYADLALDLENKSFTYFGMTDTEMSANGYKNAENAVLTAYTQKHIKDLVDTLDTRFHPLHDGAYSVVIDRDQDKLFYKDKNSNDCVMNILPGI